MDGSESVEETFQLWTHMLVKGMGGHAQEDMRVAGIISTEASDFQGESLAQDGVDWSYFEDHGLLNYNHTGLILGEPDKVIRKGQQTLMEGRLYSAVPKAVEIYTAAQQLKKSGARRGYRFSVEGAVQERACGCAPARATCARPDRHARITKARVLNVSVCEHAVNGETRMDVLAKAATVGYQQAADIDPGYSIQALMPQSLAGARLRAEVSRLWPSATDAELDDIIGGILRA